MKNRLNKLYYLVDRHRYYGKKIGTLKKVEEALFYNHPKRKQKILEIWNKFENKLYKDPDWQHLKYMFPTIFSTQN